MNRSQQLFLKSNLPAPNATPNISQKARSAGMSRTDLSGARHICSGNLTIRLLPSLP